VYFFVFAVEVIYCCPPFFAVVVFELAVVIFFSASDIVPDGVCQLTPFVDFVLLVRLLSLLD